MRKIAANFFSDCFCILSCLRLSAGLLMICSLLIACRTIGPLPPVNLQEPGWVVRQGQAVWRTGREAPEMAGELLVALHTEGGLVVRFSKNPFPLVMAQASPGMWQIEFIPQKRIVSGKGTPPRQLLWFQIGRCLSGKQPPSPWRFQEVTDNAWRLENPISGETLEGYLDPESLRESSAPAR